MTSITAPGGIEVSENGTVAATTRQGVDTYRWLSIRRAFKLEIEANIKMMRGSVLAYLREQGITTARTKREAYNDLNAAMVEAGFDSVPLKD